MRVALTSFGCNVHGITPYLKHIEAFRRYENSIMPVEYPLSQLLQACGTWKLPNCCHWEAN